MIIIIDVLPLLLIYYQMFSCNIIQTVDELNSTPGLPYQINSMPSFLDSDIQH